MWAWALCLPARWPFLQGHHLELRKWFSRLTQQCLTSLSLNGNNATFLIHAFSWASYQKCPPGSQPRSRRHSAAALLGGRPAASESRESQVSPQTLSVSRCPPVRGGDVAQAPTSLDMESLGLGRPGSPRGSSKLPLRAAFPGQPHLLPRETRPWAPGLAQSSQLPGQTGGLTPGLHQGSELSGHHLGHAGSPRPAPPTEGSAAGARPGFLISKLRLPSPHRPASSECPPGT